MLGSGKYPDQSRAEFRHAWRATQVEITVKQDGDGRLRVRVTDNGCGFRAIRANWASFSFATRAVAAAESGSISRASC